MMIDFRQYWSAFQLVTEGLNPYQPEVMHAFQQSYFGDRGAIETVMMWNPPWLLLFLSPILWMDYKYSEIAWSVLNIGILTISIFLLLRGESIISGFLERVLFIIVLASFPPLIDSLKFGQLGLFLLLGTILVFYGLVQKKAWLFGLSLCLISVKPHIFLILGAFLGSWIITTRQFGYIIKGIAALSALIILTLYIWPGILQNWLIAMLDQPKSEIIFRPWQWKTATITTSIREQFLLSEPDLGYSFALSIWLYVFVPIAIFLGAIHKRAKLEAMLPLLLCLSLILSPFTWYFDMTVLLICYPRLIRYFGAWLLLGFHALVFLFSYFWLNAQHHFWWFSIVMCMMYAVAIRSSIVKPKIISF